MSTEEHERRNEDDEVSEETRQNRREHAAEMARMESILEESRAAVRRLQEENEQERNPLQSETILEFRRVNVQLQAARDDEVQRMNAAGKRILRDHIASSREEVQEYVDRLSQQEESQEEARRANRQAEIDFSLEFNENGQMRSVCEAVTTSIRSLKQLYKDIGQEISMLPKNLKTVSIYVSTAVRTGRASLAKSRLNIAQIAFTKIENNITNAIQKSGELLRACELETVDQGLITALVTMRNESKQILDGILASRQIWNSTPDENGDWLRSLETEMKFVDDHITAITDSWSNVRIPEN